MHRTITITILLLLLAPAALAQDSTFTYQGQLDNNGSPASGSFDFEFRLFDADSGGSLEAGPVSVEDLTVSDGLFAAEIDFGSSVFGSGDVWLEIGVREGASTAAFSTLEPRQPVTPTPLAHYALKVADSAFDPASVWLTGGNAAPAGAFLGTTNAEPLELRAADRTVMRILDAEDSDDNHAPNLIAGSQLNQLDQSGGAIAGATIAGGGGDPTQTFCGPDGTSPCVNTVSADYATVLGGYGNYATSFAATAIGRFTMASGSRSTAMGTATIASGFGATAMGSNATASGASSTAMGLDTVASGARATAMGNATTASGENAVAMGIFTDASGNSSAAFGESTSASGVASTAMGFRSEAGGDYSLAAGRRAEARAADDGTFVWADSQNADFVSTGPNQFLVRAAGGAGINTNAPLAPLTVRGEGKWNPDIGNGFGDFHVGNEEYGLAIGVANGPGAGAGAVRFWPKGGNEAIVFTTGDSYPDRTLTLSDSRLVGVRRNPATNALEVAGNASKSSAGSWLANSDARIKTDVEDIPGALDRLMQVRPVTFRYSQAYRDAHPDLDETRYYNVVAQDFARVFPDAVKGSGEFLPGRPQTPDNEILQVDTHPALITSIAAVQELAVRLEQAEARNTALEAGLSELRTELAILRELVAKSRNSP